ncbi:cell division protein PerM [Actinokineospora diospyrosa]|uniref:Membrane protein related to de Novo purine biosynthesis n=1 Tax=Actinokineospora diospyrosa TaxID=103728 RepID=A0ABT1IIH4_9PSEU|nr:DUF6350 family protein [Actinokineospora diospyrosa]MCP2272438.1 hypothetical protein [Actinokineospora diospyrosa]
MPHTDLLEAEETDRVVIARSLRGRVLAVAAVGPLLTGYAAVAAVLALVTAIAARALFTTPGVLAAAVPGWLAAYQVPVRVEGHELGALPLLPTLLVLVLVWRTAAAAAERLAVATPREAGHVVGAIVGAHAAVGLTLALLCSGGTVTIDPLAGLYYPALLSGIAAVAGVVPRAGVSHVLSERMDAVALRGLRAGLLAIAALLAAGALVLTLALALSFSTVKGLFAVEDFGGGVGMLLLSLGYLPNAVVAATGFAAGPGFSLGSVVVSPMDFSGGAVPPLPLLGALPEHGQPWWLVLFALPGAVGTLVGWVLREVDESPRMRLRAVAVASVVVAMAFAVMGGASGGALGGGPFHPLDLRAAWLSLALVAWIAIPGGLVAWTSGPQPVVVEPEPLDEEFDETSDSDDPDAPDDGDGGETEPEDESQDDAESVESEDTDTQDSGTQNDGDAQDDLDTADTPDALDEGDPPPNRPAGDA